MIVWSVVKNAYSGSAAWLASMAFDCVTIVLKSTASGRGAVNLR